MSVSHRYQDFRGFSATSDDPQEQLSDALEDQKLVAFEDGYRAGWDDALKSQSDENAKIAADFAQQLQDMEFTFHEALAKLTSTMEPLMAEIVAKLLPRAAQATLGVHIIEQLNEMIRKQADQPIEIVVAPGQSGAVSMIAGDAITGLFEIIEEPALGEGQAHVRIGSQEREIDLDAVIQGIGDAMTAFFHQSRQEQKNG